MKIHQARILAYTVISNNIPGWLNLVPIEINRPIVQCLLLMAWLSSKAYSEIPCDLIILRQLYSCLRNFSFWKLNLLDGHKFLIMFLRTLGLMCEGICFVRAYLCFDYYSIWFLFVGMFFWVSIRTFFQFDVCRPLIFLTVVVFLSEYYEFESCEFCFLLSRRMDPKCVSSVHAAFCIW